MKTFAEQTLCALDTYDRGYQVLVREGLGLPLNIYHRSLRRPAAKTQRSKWFDGHGLVADRQHESFKPRNYDIASKASFPA